MKCRSQLNGVRRSELILSPQNGGALGDDRQERIEGQSARLKQKIAVLPGQPFILLT